MREVNGVVYYTSGDVAVLLDKSRQTLIYWDLLSDCWAEKYGRRALPKPIRINGHRLYKKEQVLEIIKFSKSMKRGTLTKAKKVLEETRKFNEQLWAVEDKPR
ncbi:hypothetical protein JCM17380_16420 [Desulfosporosinus burensis]